MRIVKMQSKVRAQGYHAMTHRPTGFFQEATISRGRAVSQLHSLGVALMSSASRRSILFLMVGISVVVGATAIGQVRLNAWNKPFYDAVAQKDVASFLIQLLTFAVIVSVLLMLNVSQGWLQQMIRLKLREWLTQDLLAHWLQQKREFRVTRIGDLGSNPDQRIHQDGQHLTDLSTDLGIGLLQSSLLLGFFIGILWMLSTGILLTVAGHRFAIPGYMVWAALLYAATGSWVSWQVGHPLVALNATRYAQEAEFRAALAHTHEAAHCVALYGKEQDEQRHLLAHLTEVLAATRQITVASFWLSWVTAGYGWAALVVPILVASPGYFGGNLSFGELMMVVGAFQQVQQALRWFVDNVGTIADWRATLLRVTSFRDALTHLEGWEKGGDRIEFAEDPTGRLRFENLSINTPVGPSRLVEGDVEVKPGEHVLVVGKPASGKTTLFLAIAGLSPWGTGRISCRTQAQWPFCRSDPTSRQGRSATRLGRRMEISRRTRRSLRL